MVAQPTNAITPCRISMLGSCLTTTISAISCRILCFKTAIWGTDMVVMVMMASQRNGRSRRRSWAVTSGEMYMNGKFLSQALNFCRYTSASAGVGSE